LVVVRIWTQADIDYVTESVAREGWGFSRRDMERCWRYEPNGCFIAEVDGEPVGHVFSISYGKLGWIGLLIVDPEARGRGVGEVLMQAAVDYLQRVGVETIRLEAVERAVPLYRRLGFREEFDSLRFCRQLEREESREAGLENVFRMQESDVEKVAKFDSRYFGANRLRVLQSLYRSQPENCFVARDKRRLLGYILGRRIFNVHRIGPWVCANFSVAEGLLNVFMEAVGGDETELRVGMPVVNRDGLALMEKMGFRLMGKSVRMVLGKRGRGGVVTGVYGIGGPEKG